MTGTVIDTQSVSGFNGGKYLVWNIAGSVTIHISVTGGLNAVLSGMFYDHP